jgi:hypothetical protein
LDGTNLGGADLFVAKYNTAGDRQWIRQIGTGAADVAHGVSIGPDGSVYVAGATEGELEAGTAAGASDLFIAKLDASGAWQWMRQLGSVQSDVAHALDVDAAGTLYIAGGTAGELDGQSNPSGGEIGFIVTYDSAGSKQSTRTLCPSDCLTRRSRLNSIALDGSGRAFFGGWTTTVGASNELGPKEALRGEFSGGAFSMLNWNGGSGERAINGIALDPIHGQLYSVDTVLYEFAYGSIGRVTRASLATFIENSIDIVGSPNTETELRAITSDGASNAYAVGFTRGSVDDHNNLGGTDMVIVRYNAAGEKL